VYFGSTNQSVMPGFCLYINPYNNYAGQGCNGEFLGSGVLYQYSAGSFTTTAPHGPYFGDDPQLGITCNGAPVPSYNCSVGNVSAINAAQLPNVEWASDYAMRANYIPNSELEWGGSGGTATTPPAPYNHDFMANPNGGDIVSILIAHNGQFWAGAGGPAPNLYPAAVPAICGSYGRGCDLFWLVNGPHNNVWAMTHANANNSNASGTIFFEFSPSGTLLKTITTPHIAVRIAGTSKGVWFTDYANNAIGEITGNGKITERPLLTQGAGPYGITAAADGTIWFTEFSAQKVGHIGKNGRIHEFALSFQPFSIAATPAGCITPAIWVGSLGDQLADVSP
jgi:hypothetical protein